MDLLVASKRIGSGQVRQAGNGGWGNGVDAGQGGASLLAEVRTNFGEGGASDNAATESFAGDEINDERLAQIVGGRA